VVPDNLLAGVRELARRTEKPVISPIWLNTTFAFSPLWRKPDRACGWCRSRPLRVRTRRANGKVLLAYAPLEVRQRYLGTHPLVPLTDKTTCDPRRFEQELEGIRKRGYAYDDEEFAIDVSCVGVPLLLDGHLDRRVGLSVPTERFKKRRAELIAVLLEVVSTLRIGIDD
jgi:hypothetical protein